MFACPGRKNAIYGCAAAFSILLSGSAIAGPVVFWDSDPIRPGETVLAIGDQLSKHPYVSISLLPDSPTANPDHFENQETILKPTLSKDHILNFIVPASFPLGVYRYLVRTESGEVIRYLNKPIVYWAQGDAGHASTAGGWLRIFGRNISKNAGAIFTLSAVSGAAEPLILRAKIQNDWEASFDIPTSLPSGRYLLKVWNGHGDAAAWSDGIFIEITPDYVPSSLTLSVRDFGAKGDGSSDDTAAVRLALRAISDQGGGTILFPRGQYRLSGSLFIPPHVTIRGESRELVALSWSDFTVPPENLIEGNSDFSVADLTIYSADHRQVISGGFSVRKSSAIGNIKIHGVTIRSSAFRGHITSAEAARKEEEMKNASENGTAAIRLRGPNLQITDCDVYSSTSALFLYRPKGAYVARNKFYNGRGGWYSISGADGVIFEENKIMGADLAASGGGINTLFGSGPSSQNIYFARNVLSLMFGWDGEAMTSDGPGGFYYGPVAAANVGTLTMVGKSPIDTQKWVGAGIFILGGRGMGQFAQVLRVDGMKVTFDRDLKVAPDLSSTVTIVPMQQNYIFLSNTITDAGIGVQFYGTSLNHIVADNVSVRTQGFASYGLKYDSFQPSWYIQFIDNTVREGVTYKMNKQKSYSLEPGKIGVYGLQQAPNVSPLVLGIIVRGNKLEGNARIELQGRSEEHPGVEGVVVEGNSVTDSDNGIILDKGTAAIILRNNKFDRVNETVKTKERSP